MTKTPKRRITEGERQSFNRLQDFASRLDELLELFDGTRIPSADVAIARRTYGEFKTELEAEVKRCKKIAFDPWYAPTVTEAFLKLAPVRAKPENWFRGLYDAQTDFSHMLASMRTTFGLKDEDA